MSSSTDSMTQRPLTESEVNERRDLSARLVIERKSKRIEKKASVDEFNGALKKFDEQIDKLGFEIHNRLSWVPAEPLYDKLPGYNGGSALAGENTDDGDDGDGDDGDGDDERDPSDAFENTDGYRAPEPPANGDDAIVEPASHAPRAGKKASKKKTGKKASRKR